MTTEKKSQGMFLGFTFIWSYVFWGIAIFLSLRSNVKILENADFLRALLNKNLSHELRNIAIFSTLAGYGPMLAAVFLALVMPESRKYYKGKLRLKITFKYALQVLALFLLITLLPALPLFIRNGYNTPISLSLLGFLLFFFFYQIITAGTEEIGWRGFYLGSLLREKTPWQASMKIGIIWALWHFPIIIYVFYTQGLPLYQIILSFGGFIAGTIAMATVHTYYYFKTNNIVFNVFLHGVANTIPMFMAVVVGSSYEISVGVQILLWVFVMIITRKNKELFDSLQK